MYVCIRMKVHERYLLCTLNADFRSPVLPRQILVPANTIVCSINVPTPTNRCISPEAYPLATPLSILPSSILFLYQLLVVFKQFIYIKKKKKKKKKERKKERKKEGPLFAICIAFSATLQLWIPCSQCYLKWARKWAQKLQSVKRSPEHGNRHRFVNKAGLTGRQRAPVSLLFPDSSTICRVTCTRACGRRGEKKKKKIMPGTAIFFRRDIRFVSV